MSHLEPFGDVVLDRTSDLLRLIGSRMRAVSFRRLIGGGGDGSTEHRYQTENESTGGGQRSGHLSMRRRRDHRDDRLASEDFSRYLSVTATHVPYRGWPIRSTSIDHPSRTRVARVRCRRGDDGSLACTTSTIRQIIRHGRRSTTFYTRQVEVAATPSHMPARRPIGASLRHAANWLQNELTNRQMERARSAERRGEWAGHGLFNTSAFSSGRVAAAVNNYERP